MKKTTIIILLITCSFVLKAQDATEIVSKAFEKHKGESSYSEMTMRIVRPSWERNISMKTWSKGTEYSMVLITAPAKENGQAFLKRDKEMWNWQPQINKMIKLPPSMMMQSWMGSDFTNDDLINESSIVEEYTHVLKKNVMYKGEECYYIELIPKENAAVVWGKILMIISVNGYHIFKTAYYDEYGDLIKTELATEVKVMDGIEMTTVFTTIPADKKSQKTVLTMNKVDIGTVISDDFFSQQNMKRLRQY
jgi:Outer membrane lipoprotein-sorting protein